MRQAYPIVLMSEKEGGYVVFVPDFQINTEGADMAEALFMARDAIGLMGIAMQDDGNFLPMPSHPSDSMKQSPSDIVTLVDVDFDECRRQNDMRAVKKNCTIPAWLEHAATKSGINFSAVLQRALQAELHIDRP